MKGMGGLRKELRVEGLNEWGLIGVKLMVEGVRVVWKGV